MSGSTSTTQASIPSAGDAQNYILYRTAALTLQPASYKDMAGNTVNPPVMTISPVGMAIGVQMLTGLNGISVPDGLAYALDAAGKYPVGSICTPPAAT